MHSEQLTKALTVVLAIGVAMIAFIAPVSALADTFTFDVADGNWETAGNWDPELNAPPGSEDLAIIPDNTICRVKTRDEDALEVVVESGGTLIVEEGNSLTLHGHVGVADHALIVDGDLFLEESSGGAASAIKFETGVATRKDFVITGVGVISALADDDGKGLVKGLDTEHVRLIVDSGLLVTGTIAFEDLDVRNNGDFYVSAGVSVDDVMTFDGATPAGAAIVSGAGTFEVDGAGAAMVMTDVLVGIDGRVYVTGGDLEFGYTAAPILPPTMGAPFVADLSLSPLLSVDGGTVSVYGNPPTFTANLRLHNVDATLANGGLIECDGDLTLVQRSTLTVTNGDVDLGGDLFIDSGAPIIYMPAP